MRNYCTETAASVVEERKLKKENASNGFFDEGGKDEAAPTNLLDALFDSQSREIRNLLGLVRNFYSNVNFSSTFAAMINLQKQEHTNGCLYISYFIERLVNILMFVVFHVYFVSEITIF